MTDLIITTAIAILTIALIPTVINQFRAKASTMPLTTSIPSLVALTLLLAAYISQGWWFSVGITVFNYALWGILVVQRRMYYPKWHNSCTDIWDNEADAVYDKIGNECSLCGEPDTKGHHCWGFS